MFLISKALTTNITISSLRSITQERKFGGIMGGDTVSFFASEDESSLENKFACNPASSYKVKDGFDCGLNGFVYEDFYVKDDPISSNPVEFDVTSRRRKNAYDEIMKNYDEQRVRKDCLYQAKTKVLGYIPDSWINDVCGKNLGSYSMPKMTTVLLVGPKGSGKSSLVNKISRVFEDDKFASERAQVTYNSSCGEGTFFLEEYMIPRGTSSFCLFDSRGLSENLNDNEEMVQRWMEKGVRHGELVIRDSDSYALKMALKCKARHSGASSTKIRKVNFVIFVVNGFSVLRSMNSNKEEDKYYIEMVVKIFNCPYLSFKDDKPVIAVTHGDLLSLVDRARVRIYLGEKLGVPPAKQIFDIPENLDLSTEFMIVEMIRYALEHAEKNFPYEVSRDWTDTTILSEHTLKVFSASFITFMFLALLLGIGCVLFPMHQSLNLHNTMSTSNVNWHTNSLVKYPSKPLEPLMSFSSNLHSKYDNNLSLEPQTISPPLGSKSVIDYGHDRRKKHRSRCSSPRRTRHPKSAVEWHKIRHLWLDE